jgi:hypothetical protein
MVELAGNLGEARCNQMPEAIKGRLSKAGSCWRAAFTVVLACGYVAPGDLARARDLNIDPAIRQSLDDDALSIDQWQEHVRAEKRRIQKLAAQRRLDRLQEPVASPPDENRWASEQIMNDITLERGDIIVTDKGAFVFKGRSQDERKPGDFEPAAGYSVRR